MLKLLVVFAAALVLAYISEQNTKAITASGQRYSTHKDWAYVLLVIILVLFAGLRTSYNDTGNYIRGFQTSSSLADFFANPDNLNPFKNPLFQFSQRLIKAYTDNSQVWLFLTAMFSQICFVRFIKRYSENFTFSICIYITLGTYMFTLAALKQTLAMAVLTLSIPQLEKKHWVQYFGTVFIAMLFHTYAIAFVFLPLFTIRPWRPFTYLFVFLMVVLMMNFTGVITEFMEQANDLGKTLTEEELFDDNTVNIFRLAVYAVVPLMSFFFQKWLFVNSHKMDHVLIHMSIISLACMSMGTQSGANMFGRMATYFELGTVCCLPWMLKQIFEERSCKLITAIAVSCYFFYFVYANGTNGNFDTAYSSVTLWKFIQSLFIG